MKVSNIKPDSDGLQAMRLTFMDLPSVYNNHMGAFREAEGKSTTHMREATAPLLRRFYAWTST